MSDFKSRAKLHQLDWRDKHLPDLREHGTHGGRKYSHLVPAEHWTQGLFQPIRESLPQYLSASRIQPHSQKHNLLSSWMLCANVYFPFRGDPHGKELLSAFLESNLGMGAWKVVETELEYSAPPPLDPATLLGERRGRRGANQTSPDVAFLLSRPPNDKALVLVECKYVESDFGMCSGYSQSRSIDEDRRNHHRERCNSPDQIIKNPAGFCHLVSWERRYWDHLIPTVDKAAFGSLAHCPARSKGYQLLREYAYAQALKQSGRYECVTFAIAWDLRNATLANSMYGVGLENIQVGWSKLFPDGVPIKTWDHAEWVGFVEVNGGSHWSRWVDYIRARYDLANRGI